MMLSSSFLILRRGVVDRTMNKGSESRAPKEGTDEVEQVFGAPGGTLSYTEQGKGEHGDFGASCPGSVWLALELSGGGFLQIPRA